MNLKDTPNAFLLFECHYRPFVKQSREKSFRRILRAASHARPAFTRRPVGVGPNASGGQSVGSSDFTCSRIIQRLVVVIQVNLHVHDTCPTTSQHAQKGQRYLNDVTISHAVAKKAGFALAPYFVNADTATNKGRPTTIGLALRVPKVSLHMLPAGGMTCPLAHVAT